MTNHSAKIITREEFQGFSETNPNEPIYNNSRYAQVEGDDVYISEEFQNGDVFQIQWHRSDRTGRTAGVSVSEASECLDVGVDRYAGNLYQIDGDYVRLV